MKQNYLKVFVTARVIKPQNDFRNVLIYIN